jgi:glycosyltransferase involved in cell wall biosynthesis
VLHELGLEPRRYVLYVARFEQENNPELVIEAFRRVETAFRLVLVGSATYAAGLARRLEELAARDPRVLLAGPRYGESYAELQSHAACYVQASEVGGTHPALVEAMGYGGRVVVNDIPEHREVVGDAALVYEFNNAASLAGKIQEMLDDASLAERSQAVARERVRTLYDWERVAHAYEAVLLGTDASDYSIPGQ